MRFEVRPDSRDPVFLRLAQCPADQHDGRENDRQMPMPLGPQPQGDGDSGPDQYGRLPECAGDTSREKQSRPVPGIKRLVDFAIQRSATQAQHRQPGRRERDDKGDVERSLAADAL